MLATCWLRFGLILGVSKNGKGPIPSVERMLLAVGAETELTKTTFLETFEAGNVMELSVFFWLAPHVAVLTFAACWAVFGQRTVLYEWANGIFWSILFTCFGFILVT